MMYHASGMGVGLPFVVLTIGLPLLVLLAGLVFAHFQRAARPPERSAVDAEHLLADRLARGEIDREDYQRRLRILRTARR